MATKESLTPTQRRMIDVMSDGMSHGVDELIDCLSDAEMGSVDNVKVHLTGLRKILRPQGQDVLCELVNGSACYRHVRLLASPNSGYS